MLDPTYNEFGYNEHVFLYRNHSCLVKHNEQFLLHLLSLIHTCCKNIFLTFENGSVHANVMFPHGVKNII